MTTEAEKAREQIEAQLALAEQGSPDLTSISWNGAGPVLTEADFARLCQALSTHADGPITSVSLVSCKINNGAAVHIAEMLKVNRSLTTLNLETNNITADGILALADALANQQTLTELKLSNQASYCGAEAERTMATIFETNQTLVKLAWSVRDTGARDRIDRGNTRNREIARRKRMDAKRS